MESLLSGVSPAMAIATTINTKKNTTSREPDVNRAQPRDSMVGSPPAEGCRACARRDAPTLPAIPPLEASNRHAGASADLRGAHG